MSDNKTKSQVIERMWQRHFACPTKQTRDALIEFHLYLVDQTFRHLYDKKEKSMDVDLVKSAGRIGLVTAFDRFDPGRGVKFPTYAIPVIAGAMRDDIRSSQWAPRGISDKWKAIDSAVIALIRALHRDPTGEETAAWLEWSMEDYLKIQGGRLHNIAFSIDMYWHTGEDYTMEFPDPSVDVYKDVSDSEDIQRLYAAIYQLAPVRAYVVRSMLNHRPTSEIAIELGYSQCLIYKIYRESVSQLRLKLDPDAVWNNLTKK